MSNIVTAALPVSRVTLGTMRLGGAGGVVEVARLLAHARDTGVRSFHCSSEYDSFALFAAAWRRAGMAQTGATVIAKLASPHFGEHRFSAAQVREKIDLYRRELGVERIDTVQWLLRHDLKQEEARLRIFEEATGEIGETVVALKAEGRIAAFAGFPYTRPIAAALLASAWCDAIACYVNPLERELDPIVQDAAGVGKAVIAIRPFAAGRIFVETGMDAAAALAYPFGFSAVATVVASASSTAHLDAFVPMLVQ